MIKVLFTPDLPRGVQLAIAIFDIEKEREKFEMDKEKLEISHRHQLELLQKESENNIGASLTNTLISEAMKIPEIRQQISQGVKSSKRKKT